MNLDDNTTKIILAIIGILIAGGAISLFNYTKKKSNNKSLKKTIKVNQKKIKIEGGGDVIGGNKTTINDK